MLLSFPIFFIKFKCSRRAFRIAKHSIHKYFEICFGTMFLWCWDVLLFSFLKSSFTTLHMLVQWMRNIKAEISSIQRYTANVCENMHPYDTYEYEHIKV